MTVPFPPRSTDPNGTAPPGAASSGTPPKTGTGGTGAARPPRGRGRRRRIPRPVGGRVAAILILALGLALATAAAGVALNRALGGAGRIVLDEGRPWVAPASLPGEGFTRRVVTVVTAPGLDLDLLRRLEATDPTWARLLRQAAVGLMTAHTGGYYGREAGYLTLGAGARAVSGPTAGWILPGDQVLEPGTALALFNRWWPGGPVPAGAPLPGPQELPPQTQPAMAGAGADLPPVVHWGWEALQRANEALDHPVPLGSLATALHQAGLEVAAIGNADLPSGPWTAARPGAALLAADGRGWIDMGLVDGRVLQPDPAFPGGWRTRWDAVLEAWAAARRRAALVVVEAGDLGRLEDLAPALPEETLRAARLEAGRRLGRALAVMAAGLGPEDRLVLLNPAPGSEARASGETLMPVVSWGAGPGLLASPSTRRAGVVANTDLAPMVAAHLGAPPHPAWIGRPWVVVPASGRQWGDAILAGGGQAHAGGGAAPARGGAEAGRREALAALERLHASLVANYQRRAAFIRLFVGAGLVLTAGPLLALWRRGRRLERWILPLTALAAFPLANLLLPAWPAGPGWRWWSGTPSVLLAAVLAVALALGARQLAGSTLGAFGAIGLWTATVTVVDVLAGAWLAQLTPFGYSPIGGARFYGIGNEYMGVLIGSTAVAAAAWAELRRRRARYQARPQGPSSPDGPAGGPERSQLRPAPGVPAGGPGRRQPRPAPGAPGGSPQRLQPPPASGAPAPSPRWPGLGRIRAWATAGGRRPLPALVGVPLALGLVALVLADPSLGSNFGGALSAAVAACGPVLAVAIAARRHSLRWRVGAALLLLGAPMAVGLAMAVWDRQLGASATHVMATWEQVQGVGPQALLDVVVRKVTMNLRLMRYTNWSYLFVMLVFAYAFVIYRRAAVVRELERRQPEAVRGLAAVAAGSLAALLLNDSGIVAAATTLVYGATLLLALAAGLDGPAEAPPGRRGPAAPARGPAGPATGHP